MKKKMTHSLLSLVLIADLLLVSCGSKASEENDFGIEKKTQNGSYLEITAKELATIYEDEDLFMIAVDAPTPNILIPGTDARIPYDEFMSRLDEIPEAPDARILIYCTTAAHSYEVATQLADIGYTNVYELYNGSYSWSSQGYVAEIYE